MQVYSARLRVHARLSGLRRLMYHHPLVTGVLGTAATFCSLAAVFLLVWLRSAELPVQVREVGPVPSRPVPVRRSVCSSAWQMNGRLPPLVRVSIYRAVRGIEPNPFISRIWSHFLSNIHRLSFFLFKLPFC